MLTSEELFNDAVFLKYEESIKDLIKEENLRIIDSPKIGCEDARKDFRFRLGKIHAYKNILKLNEARRKL